MRRSRVSVATTNTPEGIANGINRSFGLLVTEVTKPTKSTYRLHGYELCCGEPASFGLQAADGRVRRKHTICKACKSEQTEAAKLKKLEDKAKPLLHKPVLGFHNKRWGRDQMYVMLKRLWAKDGANVMR